MKLEIYKIQKLKLVDKEISFLLLITYSTTCWFSITIGTISLVGLSFLFLYELSFYKKSRIFKKQILFFKLIAIFLGYLIFNIVYSGYILKMPIGAQINSFIRYVQLLFFIMIGYFFYKHFKKLDYIIFFSILGVLLGLFLNQDWSQWHKMLYGFRSGTNKWPYCTMGLYAATMLFTTIFEYHFFKKKNIIYLYFVLIIIFTHALIVSQNRTTWISVLFTLFILLIFFLLKKKNLIIKKVVNQKRIIFLSFGILFILVFLITLNFSSLKQRITCRDHSLYQRECLWNLGISKWKQHPWIGWGIGTRVNRDTSLTKQNQWLENFPHLHSCYVELLVRTGIVGFSLILLINLYVLVSFIKLWYKGKVKDRIFFIILSVVILSAIACATDFRILHRDFRFYYIFFWGIIYAHLLKGEESNAFPSMC